jgi:hypothetical protein
VKVAVTKTAGKKSTDEEGELKLQATMFGVPVSALALISLVQRVFHVGLTPVLMEIVATWRRLTEPLAALLKFIASFVPFHLPDWYHDAFILSFILALILFKAIFLHVTIPDDNDDPKLKMVTQTIGAPLLAFVLSLALLGLAGSAKMVVNPHNRDMDAVKREEFNRARAHFLRDVFAVISLTVVFFAANTKL